MTNKNIIPDGLYVAIASVIQQARQQVKQAVNQQMVQAYWHIGRLIVEQEQQGQERAEYGKQQLNQLSKRLQGEFGKGFDVTNLRNMRQFYLTFPKRDALRLELSWTHYRSLIRIENAAARDWYADEAAIQGWSARDLEQAIIANLQQFLLELGKGFAFVERQQRIRTDDGDYFIDLVFYNFHLKCFLLIDLKMHKLTHQDVGQMDMYVRLYEEQKRRADDNPTIGLILCSENNNTVAKYSVLNESKQLFASKYVTELPSEDELRQELERERAKVLRIQEAAANYNIKN